MVCLNHDGLLQKAGCPQEAVLEVQGSWFDPANPALRRGGRVRPFDTTMINMTSAFYWVTKLAENVI